MICSKVANMRKQKSMKPSIFSKLSAPLVLFTSNTTMFCRLRRCVSLLYQPTVASFGILSDELCVPVNCSEQKYIYMAIRESNISSNIKLACLQSNCL